VRAARLLVLALVAGVAPAQDTWRSALYPADWTPAFTDADGRFLHDFSYAGYRRGEAPLPDVDGSFFDVAAPPAGRDATAIIQAALDRAAERGGGVVRLAAGRFRVDGTLRIGGSGVVLRGAGAAHTFLRFTKDGGLDGKAHLTARGRVARGPDRPLAEDAASRATEVVLASVDGIGAGDRVALGIVVDDAFRAAHGMQAYWKFAAGKWRALFRREVVAVDRRRKRVTLDIPLRYPLAVAHHASLRTETGHLREVGIEDLAVCNAIEFDAAWKATRVHAIDLRDCLDCWVRGVRSFAADPRGVDTRGRHLQSGGIRVHASARVTIRDCHLALPQHRGGGGNGYLFEVRQSGEVLTVDCTARAGRHNFIQNWDLGTSGCVWLRCRSEAGHAVFVKAGELGVTGLSEYHHSLAMACLVDVCRLDDGWKAANRGGESSGAGHTATQCVFWNTTGAGRLRCHQFGTGYVIGTGPELRVETHLGVRGAAGTAPADYTEGLGRAATLVPRSLYEDQLRKRLRVRKAADGG
jgi:hypothetical protein